MAAATETDSFLHAARDRMVDSQIRPNRVSDPRILNAMRQLPRQRFLPAPLAALAYADENIDLGSGRVLLQPMVLARMVQAAEPAQGEAALVVGAGTGYSAALLAAIGCKVTAVEENGPLFELATAALAAIAPSVVLVRGPLTAGWTAAQPYDLILIDGAVPAVPADLARQLRLGIGRLVAIIAESSHMGYAVRAEPTPMGVSARALFDCRCPILPGFEPARTFRF